MFKKTPIVVLPVWFQLTMEYNKKENRMIQRAWEITGN